MKALFFLGWAFLLAAFASAAAETIALTLGQGGGWLMTANDLWRALYPGAHVLVSVQIQALVPGLWDPVLTTILTLPAWFLFGLPGVLLTWTYRPGREMTEAEAIEFEEHEASLFLYDDLAREARIWAHEEGEPRSTDDRLPNQDVIDLFNRADQDDKDEDDDEYPNGPPPLDPLPEFVKPRRD